MGPDTFLCPEKFWIPLCGCLGVLTTARSASVSLWEVRDATVEGRHKAGGSRAPPSGSLAPAGTGRGCPTSLEVVQGEKTAIGTY